MCGQSSQGWRRPRLASAAERQAGAGARGGAMTETTAGGVYQHQLNSQSVGFPGVLMQSVAQISPTLGIFYTIAFITGQTGITAPLTYVVAFILCLTLAVPLAGLARE